jgi:transcription elongation factor GreA
MVAVHYLTTEGAQRFQTELDELKGPGRDALATRLRKAIQEGDLSENADYIQAKEDQGFLEGRIVDLTAVLSNYVLIEDGKTEDGVVAVGSKVTVCFEGETEPAAYKIVGAKEANPARRLVSNVSPFGRAVMDHHVGEKITYSSPSGPETFTVVSVE